MSRFYPTTGHYNKATVGDYFRRDLTPPNKGGVEGGGPRYFPIGSLIHYNDLREPFEVTLNAADDIGNTHNRRPVQWIAVGSTPSGWGGGRKSRRSKKRGKKSRKNRRKSAFW